MGGGGGVEGARDREGGGAVVSLGKAKGEPTLLGYYIETIYIYITVFLSIYHLSPVPVAGFSF